VHIVSGAPGSGKSALIARLCAERPQWLGLVNSLGSEKPAANVLLLSSGCPCCTGKVVLQITLARALRQTQATRALIELSDGAHADSLAASLREIPLSLSLAAARRIDLPAGASLTAAELET
jgi:G3E family GTPase